MGLGPEALSCRMYTHRAPFPSALAHVPGTPLPLWIPPGNVQALVGRCHPSKPRLDASPVPNPPAIVLPSDPKLAEGCMGCPIPRPPWPTLASAWLLSPDERPVPGSPAPSFCSAPEQLRTRPSHLASVLGERHPALASAVFLGPLGMSFGSYPALGSSRFSLPLSPLDILGDVHDAFI